MGIIVRHILPASFILFSPITCTLLSSFCAHRSTPVEHISSAIMATLEFDDKYTLTEYQACVRADFTTRAESYDSGDSGEMHRRIVRELVTRFPPPETGRVLDIACGTGLLTEHVPDTSRVTGVDLTKAMLAQARQSYPLSTFVQANAEMLPFDSDSFSCAYICSALPYFTDVSRVLQEAMRILVPGGFLGLQAVTAQSYQLGLCITQALEHVLGVEGAERTFPLMHKHTADEAACNSLFQNAGFQNVSVVTVPDRSGTFQVAKLPAWWDSVCTKNALFGRVQKLEPGVLDRVRTCFTDIVMQKADENGILQDFVELVFVVGYKPVST